MPYLKSRLTLVLCIIFFRWGDPDLAGQVLINEFLASNVSSSRDPDFHEYSDWIELYNLNVSGTDLSGCFLTDDLSNPNKWVFPPGTVIPADGYLLIWADGRNTGLHAGFKLDADGEQIGLFSPVQTLLDSVSFASQYPDFSSGRIYPDPGLVFFPVPTPGGSNTGKSCTGISGEVQFSIDGGFYDENISLNLSAENSEAVIRYTMDGSEPDSASLPYTGTLTIPSTVVVRARVYEEGKLPGKITGHTYFIHEQDHDIPVLSLFTGPANLWDPWTGIYVNYEEDWKRPCGIEYFLPGQGSAFSLNAGFSIFGGTSRGSAQKSFAVFTGNAYGDGPVEYHLLPGRDINVYKSFILRNSANDWNGGWRGTMFRDALIQTIVENRMDLDYQSYQPVSVFLNGMYWGILNLRDKHNEDYCETHYGTDRDSIDIIKNNEIVAGNDHLYNEMMDFLRNHDLSVEENYRLAESMIDVDEFIHYMITEIYSCNIDWPANNYRLWRSETEGGKWRWMLFDMDFGFNGFQWAPPSTNMFAKALDPDIDDYVRTGMKAPWATLAFIKLTQSSIFRAKFISAFISQAGTTYNPGRVIHIVDSLAANLEKEMPFHIARWSADGGIVSMQEWHQNIQGMRDFANSRPYYALKQLAETFGLQEGDKAGIEIISGKGGSLKLCGAPVDSPDLSLEFYKDLPLELSMAVSPGYSFEGWTVEYLSGENAGMITTKANPLELIVEGPLRITARIQRDDMIPELKINEIMAGNSNDMVDEYGDHDDWIEIYNAGEEPVDLGGLYMTDLPDNPQKWQIPGSQPGETTVVAGAFIVLWADEEPVEGNLHLDFKLSKSGEFAGIYKNTAGGMIVIDTVSFPSIQDDISFSRYPDGNGPWEMTDRATPGSGNIAGNTGFMHHGVLNPVAWPNPTTGIVHISGVSSEISAGTTTAVTVISCDGRLARQLSFHAGEIPVIDLSDQPAGLYLLRIMTGGRYFTREIVLVKQR